MKWYRINTPDHKEVFTGFVLLNFRGWNIVLHRFVGADAPGCFHTHPAKTFRFILWGGYVEEIPVEDYANIRDVMKRGDKIDYDATTKRFTLKRTWKPLRFGIVRPEFEHRVHSLRRKSSWTFWVRSPVTHEITTRGC